MPSLIEYHKPSEQAEVVALLGRKKPRTIPLAGGTWLNPRLGQEIDSPFGKLDQVEAVVNLSGLELNHIERDPDTLRLGPMSTLAAVAENEICQSLAGGLLAQAAQREASVNVRNAATIGGTVVVAPADSEFLLALLALAAELTVCCADTRLFSLEQFLQDPAAALNNGFITQVRVNIPLHIASGSARVTRTPADHPIVAAYAILAEDGDAKCIAIGGVSAKPLLVSFDQIADAQDAVQQAISSAEPYADFRGSAEYRQGMGALMARRALAQAMAQ